MQLSDLYRELHKVIQAQAGLESAMNNFKELHAPCAVGDTVPCEGWAFEGKMCRVDSIDLAKGWNDKFEYRIRATVINKNGMPGMNNTSFTKKVGDK